MQIKSYDIFDVRPNIEKSLDGFMFYSLRTWGFHCGRTWQTILIFNVLKMPPNSKPKVEFGVVVGMHIDEDYNLDILKMFVAISEPTKELMNRKLSMFRKY